MGKREFLQLAHTYKQSKHPVHGWWSSEKLDGMRCYWDGGVSRDLPKSSIPWANTAKDDRYVEPPIATGLWSRYGNVIHAPDWWLDGLPDTPLDGELWIDRGGALHQQLMSTVKQLEPSTEDWNSVTYYIFDQPPYTSIFSNGIIDGINFTKEINGWEIDEFLRGRGCTETNLTYMHPGFEAIYFILFDILRECDKKIVRLHRHAPLSPIPTESKEDIILRLDRVVELGGEGIVLRNPASIWMPERVHHMLKVKPYKDAEAQVIGYVTGRKTDKGSKLLGKMGAMVVKWDDIMFELSGFTDEERELENKVLNEPDTAEEWASANPETECPSWVQAKHFPRGCRITFRYRDVSRDGVPQEARYYRRAE